MTKLASVSERTKIRNRNELNETIKTMNISSRRVLFLAIAQLDSKKLIEEGQIFRIYAHEYAEISKIEIKKAYQQLKEATENLQNQKLRIPKNQLLEPFARIPKDKLSYRKPEGTGYRNLNLTEFCDYEKDSGYVDISFSRTAEPYLCMLEKNFTTQNLISAARLSDTNASNLYNLINENKSAGKSKYFEIEVNELKDKLQLYKEKDNEIEYYYPEFKELNRAVIKKSIRTIEEVTELKVKIEVIEKKGRKASKLKISYKTDEQHKFEF